MGETFGVKFHRNPFISLHLLVKGVSRKKSNYRSAKKQRKGGLYGACVRFARRSRVRRARRQRRVRHSQTKSIGAERRESETKVGAQHLGRNLRVRGGRQRTRWWAPRSPVPRTPSTCATSGCRSTASGFAWRSCRTSSSRAPPDSFPRPAPLSITQRCSVKALFPWTPRPVPHSRTDFSRSLSEEVAGSAHGVYKLTSRVEFLAPRWWWKSLKFATGIPSLVRVCIF